MTVIDWLLDGDPAIRWQVERDLLDSPQEVWAATQSRVATEGWGSALLARRSNSGRWAGGLYSPKWKSTTYTLLQLWRLGLPGDNPEAMASVDLLLDGRVWIFGKGSRAEFDDCVAGFGLALSSWFTVDDNRREKLVTEILERQRNDGGWNCRGPGQPDKHSSFNSTINVLEGLREYFRSAGPQCSDAGAAERVAHEWLAEHRLYRSHRTGEIPVPSMARLHFPPRWRHDGLRGLDYLRAADADRDQRFADAVAHLTNQRREDGRWPTDGEYPGQVWLEMEASGSPSRWNTLRALRVLRWWEGPSK